MTEKQVEAKVEEKVEDSEPTPYRNDYHKDLDKEDPQPDPEAVEAEATQKEEDKSFLSTSKDTEVKTHNFKKRYDDLKKHYDTKLDEWNQEKETLEAQSKAVKTALSHPSYWSESIFQGDIRWIESHSLFGFLNQCQIASEILLVETPWLEMKLTAIR